MTIHQFSPEITAQIKHAATLFHNASSNAPAGYKLIMLAFDGCSKKHDFDAIKNTGIPTYYINIMPNADYKPGPTQLRLNEPPSVGEGIDTKNDYFEAKKIAEDYGLTGMFDPRIAFVGPDNKVVAYLDSQAPNFKDTLQQYGALAPALTPKGLQRTP